MVQEAKLVTLAACMAQVLSSPTRLKLLKLIEAEELCVCELAELLAVSQPAVSQHLNKLRQAGLVTERRAGQMSLFRASDILQTAGGAIQAVLASPAAGLPEMAPYLQRLAGLQVRRAGLEGALQNQNSCKEAP